MDHPTIRFARVLHTVTVAFDIDLDARTVYQVLVDHTLPLQVFDIVPEDDDWPALTPEEQRDALDIATRSTDRWPGWALSEEEYVAPSSDPEARPPF